MVPVDIAKIKDQSLQLPDKATDGTADSAAASTGCATGTVKILPRTPTEEVSALDSSVLYDPHCTWFALEK